jgi:hypothetical protein
MKSPRRHKEDSRLFLELTFGEQVRSLNATFSYLSRAIRAHLKAHPTKSVRRQSVLNAQIERLLARATSAHRIVSPDISPEEKNSEDS